MATCLLSHLRLQHHCCLRRRWEARISYGHREDREVSLSLRSHTKGVRSAPHGDVVLCKPGMYKTLAASFFASLFVVAGLMAWSIAEAGIPGVPRTDRFVACFRCLGWFCIYFLPVHIIGISNIRGFAIFGHAPGDTSLVCCKTALGPVLVSDFARKNGQGVMRGFLASCFAHGMELSIYVLGICIRMEDPYQPLRSHTRLLHSVLL